MGSKLKILPHIFQLIDKIKPKTVLDGFAGTTRVSQALAQSGYRVIANDISVWSKTFGECYLVNRHSTSHYQPVIDHLNSLNGKDGWFTENYFDANLKKPWQRHNTRKLDSIRDEIDNLSISEIEKSVLLTSLILALDKVDNTIGHYAAYLRDWSPRSYDKLYLQVPRLIHSDESHSVHKSDIFDLINKIEDVDLAYYDPPYGSGNEKMPSSGVRYAAYYHLWKTICLNDKPMIFGKAGRRNDSSCKVDGSIFESFKKTDSGISASVDAIERLIRQTKTKHIILSYNLNASIGYETLKEIIKSNGQLVDIMEIDYQKHVMAGMCWTNEWVNQKENKELLFLIQK